MAEDTNDNVLLTADGSDTFTAATFYVSSKHHPRPILCKADGTEAITGLLASLAATETAAEATQTAVEAIQTAAESTDPTAIVGLTVRPSASFTRPADTTAYASGDIVANSTTAGSVTPLSWTAARNAGGTGMIRRVQIRKSGVSTTNASFRVHFFSATPTISTAGDNSVFASNVSGVAGYLGYCDVTIGVALSDGSVGAGVPAVGSEINFALSSGQTVYALLEARAAYTPGNAETFAVAIEALQN